MLSNGKYARTCKEDLSSISGRYRSWSGTYRINPTGDGVSYIDVSGWTMIESSEG